MTTEEAFKIIGSKGELMSETGEKGTDLYTVMSCYNGKGANVTFMF